MTQSHTRSGPRHTKTTLTSTVESDLASTEDSADAALDLDLLSAGQRVFKGKLRQVDPRNVRRSRFANRAIEDVTSLPHQQLVSLMKQAGTNTVPALAQQLEAPDETGAHLELVYGHGGS